MRRGTLIVLALAAAIAFVVALRFRKTTEVAGETATVERGSIDRIVVASGTIEPEYLVEVRPRVSGIVERFLVDEGDRVEAEQVVAELERQTLQASVREADAVLREAEVERDQAQTELRRSRELFGRGVESKDQLDQKQSRHASSEARVERARATLQRLQQELAYATITAPIDGIVLRRDLDPGAAVASVASVTGGTVLMTIADISKMHLVGVVDENEIAQIAVGMDARILTEAYEGRVFPGRVRKIAPIGDRKDNVTSFKVEVAVLEGIEDLWPRMSADADIVAERRERALIVPEVALLYEGDDIVVEVVQHSSEPQLVRHTVTLGVSHNDRVEILTGLAEGDVVKLQ